MSRKRDASFPKQKKPKIKTWTALPPNTGPSLNPSKSELEQVSQILHMLYHRNKNQHRTQKWWKWLSMLRRSVNKLLRFEGEGWRPRQEEKEKVSLERWVREVVVPGAWLAFSTVVADGQFAALGLVLVAMLARIARMVGLPDVASKVTESNAEMKSLLASRAPKTSRQDPEAMFQDRLEDMGKVVERDVIVGEQTSVDALLVEVSSKELSVEDGPDEPMVSAVYDHGAKVDEMQKRNTERKVQKPKSKTGAKKKRKRGNAIDDLFNNLI